MASTKAFWGEKFWFFTAPSNNRHTTAYTTTVQVWDPAVPAGSKLSVVIAEMDFID